MVYGIVMYDFAAERPDELEAKQGEAIIVIAQSNPEWFVAKPIGRLGGPGLIPVSFIEIRDMTTGKAVPDPQEAVQRAGVPKVEEWKKMAAEYKNSSITLGKFETSAAQQQGLEQGMDRMSLQQGPRQTQSNGQNYVSSNKINLFRSFCGTNRLSSLLDNLNKPEWLGQLSRCNKRLKRAKLPNFTRLSRRKYHDIALPRTNTGSL